MELSSNVFWHQTDYNGLRGIIKEQGLYYAYSKEDLRAYYGRGIGFPMISLCDLPLSQFDDYIDKYGGYCIGLSHEWGIQNGFNPVWYNFLGIVGPLFRMVQSLKDLKSENAYNLLSCVKPYEGTLYRKDKYYDNYRFYDEREIRKVPNWQELINAKLEPVLLGTEYDEVKEDREKKGLKKYLEELGKIRFAYSDIKFIIVKVEYQVSRIYKDLDNSFGISDESKKVEQSTTKSKNHYIPILTYKQIKEDIIGCGHSKLADLVLDTVLGWNFGGRLKAIYDRGKEALITK